MTAYVSAHIKRVTAKTVQGGKVANAEGDRKGLLHEGARSLDDEKEAKWAADNPNIRTDFASQNRVFVQRQDANGDWALTEATTYEEAEDFVRYGTERVSRLDRKMRDGNIEVCSIAMHLPKEFCVEHPKEAQAVDPKTGKLVFDKFGDPVMVSRFTPRDHDEMMRYFNDAREYLAGYLGSDANIHGMFVHLDEKTPHCQIIFDSHQVSRKDPEKLRSGYSDRWGSHRDYRYPQGTIVRGKDVSGKIISGNGKMRIFQEGFRNHMADAGWDVSRDHSDFHDVNLDKDEYAEKDNERAALHQEIETFQKKQKKFEEDYADYEIKLSALNEKEDSVQEREDELNEREQKLNAQEQSNSLFTVMQMAWMKKREDELDEREAAIKTDEELMAETVEKLDDFTEVRTKEINKDAADMYVELMQAAQKDADAVVQNAETKRDEVYEAARKKARKDVIAGLNEKISAANKAKTDADQYSKQRREDADTYYTSRTSSVAGDVETLKGEKATLEEDNRTLREDKASLTRKKNTLVDEVETLERRKKRASIGDLVAEPDKLPGAIKTVSRVVNSNIMPLRQAGMKQADLSALQSALGLMQTDSRFQALARENEAKQQSQAEKQQSDILAKRLGLD